MRKLAKWLVGIVLVLVVMVAIFAILLPSFFAPGLAIVYSASMAPAMPAGSLAITEPVDPTTIEVGDIIAFNPPWDPDPDVTVSHRVVEILSTGFVTKGDANEDPDPFRIGAEDVVARVRFHIPYVGYPLVEIRRFASSVWGFCLLIVLPAMVIFGSAARDMNFKYSPGKRRARVLKKREDRLKKRGHRR